MTLTYTYDGAAVTHNAAPSGLNVTHRADGEASFGGIPFEDPDASLVVVGHKLVTVEEDECAQPRLFTGFTTERGMGRSLDEGLFVGASPRLVDMTVVDMNAALGFRQITGSDGNRPAETWADRLTWILESEYLNEFISSDQTWIVTNTTSIEAADYRDAYATAVLDDLVDRSGGAYVYYAFWDAVASEVRLFFDNDVEVIGACTLSISNLDADVDSATVFAPTTTTKLAREPDQQYSDVIVVYDRGAKKLYRHRPSTAAAGVQRGTSIQRPYTRSLATATAQAEKWLDKHATETDRITCSIQVPADSVGLIQAGQSIAVKLTHLGAPYTAFTAMRIVSYSPKPTNDLATHYDVELELVYRPTSSIVTPPLPDWEFGGNRGSHYLWAGEIVTSSAGDIPEHGYAEWQTSTSFSVPPVPGYDLTFAHLHPNPAGAAYITPGSGWTEIEETLFVGSSADHAAVFQNTNTGELDDPIATMPSSLWAGSWVAFPAGSTLRQWKSYNHTTTGEGTTLTFDTEPLATSFLLVFQSSGSWFGGGLSYDPWAIPNGWTELQRYVSFENWGTEIDNRIVYHLGASDAGTADTTIDLGPTPGATTTHTTDPTVDDDAAAGYTVGSTWINTTTGHAYILVDSTTGSAVWVSTTAVSVFSFSTSDGVTTVDPTTELTFVGGTLADLGGGVAELTLASNTPASTVTDETTWGITPAVGSDDEYARQDHTHGSPAEPTGTGELLITDTPAGSPLVFDDILQNDAGDALLYADA